MDKKTGAIYDLILITGLIVITTIFASVVEVIDDSIQATTHPIVVSAFIG